MTGEREKPAGWDDMCVCDHHRELHQGAGACRGKARHDYPNRCGCTEFDLAQEWKETE